MDMTSDRLRNALEAGMQDMSLDAPLFEDEEDSYAGGIRR